MDLTYRTVYSVIPTRDYMVYYVSSLEDGEIPLMYVQFQTKLISDCLSEKGYTIELIASPHLNRFSVEMGGVEIFRCDIRNLLFNVDIAYDSVAQRAVEVIDEAAGRIQTDTNLPKFIKANSAKLYSEKANLELKDVLDPDIDIWFELNRPSYHTPDTNSWLDFKVDTTSVANTLISSSTFGQSAG